MYLKGDGNEIKFSSEQMAEIVSYWLRNKLAVSNEIEHIHYNETYLQFEITLAQESEEE